MNLDRYLLREAAKARLALVLTVGLGVAAGIATLLQARFLSCTVSQVFLDGKTLAEVQGFLVALALVALARAVLLWLSEVSGFHAAGRIKTDLRERLAAHLMALGPAYTRGERTGELANTLTEGVEALEAYVSQYLPQIALAALVPLTILLFVLPLDLLSGLVLLLTAPLIPLFMVLIGTAADALTRRQWQSLSRLNAHFLDVLQGLATLKMFGRDRDQIKIVERVSERHREATMGVLRVAFLSALVLEMVATISTAIVAVEVGLRLLYSQMSFEQAFFVLILAPEFYFPLRLLGTRFHAGVAGATAARRIFEVLDTPAPGRGDPVWSPAGGRGDPVWSPATWSPAGGRHAGGGSHAGLPLRGAIQFRDVHYAYDAGERAALNGVSFEIQPGKMVALVGPSGAGKSTIAFLLLKFVEPGAGEIHVDGSSLREVAPAAWRERVAWVPQNPYLFHATVAENIALARPDATRAEIARAAELARASDFIAALPDGYDTVTGERGARLSGGEAQRIALARAFLKDAPVVVLDEATANLDPENEAMLQEAMARLTEGRTALIIAHRLRTVTRADEILVLDAGRIVERGTHAELLAHGGAYARMVQAYHGKTNTQ